MPAGRPGALHRNFLDGEQWLPGLAMKDEEMTGLGDLGDSGDLFTVSFHRDQVRRSREIPIPEIVADNLVMPATFAGGSVQG